MSHELRTPLDSLLILAQLLAQNPSRNLTPKQVEYAGIIHSAGSDLLQLIDDILDLSKVEAGKMDVAPERVTLRQLIEYVEATFRPMTTQKGLEFTVTTAPGAPADLLTDDSRLRQVLRNLLSNAVKFTERGGVELRVEPAADEEVPQGVVRGGAVVAFRVRDAGIGIPEQHLETIFGAFQQADGTTRPQVRRHRPRPVHHPGDRPVAGRRGDRGQHAGTGQHLDPVPASIPPGLRGAARAAAGTPRAPPPRPTPTPWPGRSRCRSCRRARASGPGGCWSSRNAPADC
ncbi:Sensor histidine kinase RcsC [Streptomyces fumanus]